MKEARCHWRERCDLMSGVVRLTVRGKVCVSQGEGDRGRGEGRLWRLGAVVLGKGGTVAEFEDGKILIRVALM